MKENESGTLYERTLVLLKESEVSLPKVYLDTRLPYYWLKKFSSGDIKNPSVNRVQKLYEYLTGRELDV